jgi:hypothetical protein
MRRIGPILVLGNAVAHAPPSAENPAKVNAAAAAALLARF